MGDLFKMKANVILTLVSINDAPVISLPTAPTIDEDKPIPFPDLTNGITLNDVDVENRL